MLFRNTEKQIKNSVSINDEEFLKMLGIDIGDINVKSTQALTEATVFACIRILTDSVSKLTLKLYKDIDSNVEQYTGHYITNLLHGRFNDYMSNKDFFSCVEAQRNLHGNAFIYIKRGSGFVRQLIPLDSSRVQIYIDDAGLLNSRNMIWYVYTDLDGSQYKLKYGDIIHLKHTTIDGLQGISPISSLSSIVENGKASQQFVNKFYKNGMQSKGIITYTGDMDTKAEKLFREKFEQMSSGINNAHRVSMIPLGFTYQDVSMKFADSQFLEINNFNALQIANSFGIKAHQLNNLERSTHTNIAEQQRQFYVDTLQGILTSYEQEFNYKLLTTKDRNAGMYFRFNVETMLRSDIEKRYEGYRTAIQNGFLTPNEVRRKEQLQPLDGGDNLICNGNMIPITQAGTQYTKIKRRGGETDEE